MNSSNLRIISGYLSGRYIKLANLDGKLRPTKESVREAIFSAISSRVDFTNLSVLDLYSGSGAFSFESISRGASSSTMVEREKKSVISIRENAKSLQVEEYCNIINMSVDKFLDNNKRSYDICFSDPPYCSIDLTSFIKKVESQEILNKNGILVLEDEKKYLNNWLKSFNKENLYNLKLLFSKDYGINSVAIFKNE